MGTGLGNDDLTHPSGFANALVNLITTERVRGTRKFCVADGDWGIDESAEAPTRWSSDGSLTQAVFHRLKLTQHVALKIGTTLYSYVLSRKPNAR